MKIQLITLFLLIATTTSILADIGWHIERPQESIPDSDLIGTLFGHEFKLGEAVMTKHSLTFRSEAEVGSRPETELIIFIKIDDLKGDKKEWMITPATSTVGKTPHIHLKFPAEDQKFRGTLMFTQQYSMRLMITSLTESSLNGAIHISLPDYKKSYLIGAFTAKIK